MKGSAFRVTGIALYVAGYWYTDTEYKELAASQELSAERHVRRKQQGTSRGARAEHRAASEMRLELR